MESRTPALPSDPPGVVTTRTVGRVLRVRLAGEVDLWLRADLQAALSAVRQHDGPVEVDLRGVTFFGAEGVGAVLAMLHAHPRGTVTVGAVSTAALRTLVLCGVPEDLLREPPGSV